jgi:hypothetical protein
LQYRIRIKQAFEDLSNEYKLPTLVAEVVVVAREFGGRRRRRKRRKEKKRTLTRGRVFQIEEQARSAVLSLEVCYLGQRTLA